MPFQSEKQRRYLWANEPEIARDWTDTYGSGIAKALGGRIGFYRGSDRHAGTGSSSRSSSGPGPGGQGARGQATQNPGAPSGPGPGGEGARGQATQNPGITTTRSRIQDERQEDVRKKQLAALLVQQQAEKDYTRQGIMKTGPQLRWAGGAGPNIGNWASGLAGSKIGGGLGSMLFGPLGMLLGSLFGRGVGQRAYRASQTDEEETLRDIMLGQNTLLSNLFNKKKTPTGEGIETIDIRDKFDRRGDDFSEIEGQQAKLKGLALAQYRVLQKKQAYEPYGGEKMTPKDKQFLNRLEEMMKEEKMYSLPLIG